MFFKPERLIKDSYDHMRSTTGQFHLDFIGLQTLPLQKTQINVYCNPEQFDHKVSTSPKTEKALCI